MDTPWLKENNVEFFHNGEDLMMAHAGHTHPFGDFPFEEIEVLEADLELHPEAKKSLDILGITDFLERIKQYGTCMYGGFNGTADFVNGKSTDNEYYDCGRRGPCPHEGKLCGKILTENGVLSQSEIRVIKGVALDLSDKEIANRFCLSVYTVNSHLAHVRDKLGLHGRAGIAAWAVQKGLV